MRGSHLLLSKACKNSARARQCEDKVKFQSILPLALKNKVSGKSDSDKGKVSTHKSLFLIKLIMYLIQFFFFRERMSLRNIGCHCLPLKEQLRKQVLREGSERIQQLLFYPHGESTSFEEKSRQRCSYAQCENP